MPPIHRYKRSNMPDSRKAASTAVPTARLGATSSQWKTEFMFCFGADRGRLLRVAAKCLRADPAAAEDCVQAAAISVWIHRDRYVLAGLPLLPLLLNAVRRTALNEAKRAGRAARRDESLDAGEAPSWTAAATAEGDFAIKEELARALHRLTAREGVVFWHVRVRERSTDEAAVILSLSEKTVQNVLARVSSKLSAAFSQWRRR